MYNKDKQYILDIKESITKILHYTKSTKKFDEFEKNNLVFDAVVMNIIVIGESVNKLSQSFKEKYHHIEWVKIKGLRNVIAHDYFGIDIEEIWQIIQNTIPNFEEQIRKILKEL